MESNLAYKTTKESFKIEGTPKKKTEKPVTARGKCSERRTQWKRKFDCLFANASQDND